MTTRDSAKPDAHQAASTILSLKESIRSSWKNLIDRLPESPASQQVILDQLDACIVSFAGYLTGQRPADSPMALRWREMQLSRELVADATVAMGLFIEAIRQNTPRLTGQAIDGIELLPAASQFAREVVLNVLHYIAIEPDDEKWAEVVEELERVRVRRAARLKALADIARAVSTIQSPDELFEQVHAACSRIVSGNDFSISLYDPETDSITPRLLYIRGERQREKEGKAIPASLSGIVAKTQEPLAVPDYVAACAERGITPEPAYVGHTRMAWMAAPMVQGDQTIGVLAVFAPLFPFDAEDVEVLAGIARHTAVALENSRLLLAQRRRAEQLKAVNQLARRFAALRDRDILLSTAVDLIHDLFGYALVSVFLTDEDRNELVLQAHSDSLDQPLPQGLRLGIGAQGIVGDVAATGQAMMVGDVTAEPRYFGTPQTVTTRCEMAVPILREGRVLGVLDVQSPHVDAFDDEDLTTLRTVADQLAVALENADLFREEHERSRALALMLATARAAGSSLVLDEVLERLAEGIADAAGIPNCVIYLLDEDGHTLVPAAVVVGPGSTLDQTRLRTASLRVDESQLLEEVLRQGDIYFCGHQPERLQVEQALRDTLGGTCILGVPLTAKGSTLGIAFVISDNECDHFTQDRIQLIRGVADSAGLAVENARLYARSHGLAIAEERGRLAQEIHDTLAQGLTAISLHLDLADAYLPHKPEQASEKVRRALELTRENLEEARRSVLDLRAAQLHQTALPEALRRLALSFSDDRNIDVEYVTDGQIGRLSARVEIGLYRIAEEALNNVALHARANSVRVALTAKADQVSLTVSDDGTGFDQEALLQQHGGGFGLVAIRERARLLRGRLDLRSEPGHGTTLTVTVPFEGVLRDRYSKEAVR